MLLAHVMSLKKVIYKAKHLGKYFLSLYVAASKEKLGSVFHHILKRIRTFV